MKNLQNTLKTWIKLCITNESINIKKGLIYIEDFLYYDIYTTDHLEQAKKVLNELDQTNEVIKIKDEFNAKYKKFFTK